MTHFADEKTKALLICSPSSAQGFPCRSLETFVLQGQVSPSAGKGQVLELCRCWQDQSAGLGWGWRLAPSAGSTGISAHNLLLPLCCPLRLLALLAPPGVPPHLHLSSSSVDLDGSFLGLWGCCPRPLPTAPQYGSMNGPCPVRRSALGTPLRLSQP